MYLIIVDYFAYTVIDRCNPDPCQNGATCNNFGTSFTCDCTPGFAGTVCDNGTLNQGLGDKLPLYL